MFKLARILFLVYFAILFTRAAFADNCGNNGDRRAHTTAAATPKATAAPATAPAPGTNHGVKR